MPKDLAPEDRFKRWKCAFVALGAVCFPLLVVGAISAYFWYQLLSIPEVGEPFDVRKFASVSVGDERNAFFFYRRATALLVDKSLTIKASSSDSEGLLQ